MPEKVPTGRIGGAIVCKALSLATLDEPEGLSMGNLVGALGAKNLIQVL